jgi:hypothetical protein
LKVLKLAPRQSRWPWFTLLWPGSPSAQAQPTALLIDLLGLDGGSREAAGLGAAMLARAAIDPRAAATARTG